MKKELKLLKNMKWIYRQVKTSVPVCLLILFINCTASLLNVGVALTSKRMVDSAVSQEIEAAFLAALFFLTIIIARIAVNATSSAVSVKASETLANKIREKIYSKINNASWQVASAYHSGDVLTRLTSDVTAISTLLASIVPSAAALVVQLMASFVVLFYYEPRLALLAFALGPATVLFSRHWSRKLKSIQIKVQETESAYRSFIQESFQNLLVIKAFRQEENFAVRMEKLHQTRIEWIVKRNRTSIFAGSMLALGYWTGYFLAFSWGVVRLGAKSITFGTLTAFLQLVEQVQTPFIGLSRALPGVIAALASSERLIELDNLAQEAQFGKAGPQNEVGIKLSGVCFAYTDGRMVLKDIRINIKPGDIVAVVGSSGEGKTTLIKNLLSLLTPHQGNIEFYSENGKDISSCRETREYIAYVPQGNTLFSGTLEENIRFGLDDVTDVDIAEACEAAGASEFISQLKDGLKSRIGERGIGLSEGQAQRISIARALLRKAPVLILDEATSALDMETEIHVLKSIKNLLFKRTCIVITHRPSALEICSRILILKDGLLKEVGWNKKEPTEFIDKAM